MKEFINKLTGTRMFVADDREEEYRKAGYRCIPPAKEKENSDPPGGAPEGDLAAKERLDNPSPPGDQPAAKKSNTAQRQKSTGKREVF